MLSVSRWARECRQSPSIFSPCKNTQVPAFLIMGTGGDFGIHWIWTCQLSPLLHWQTMLPHICTGQMTTKNIKTIFQIAKKQNKTRRWINRGISPRFYIYFPPFSQLLGLSKRLGCFHSWQPVSAAPDTHATLAQMKYLGWFIDTHNAWARV